MNITLSIDEHVVQRAREKLRAAGKTVNQEIRDHLCHVAGDNDLEETIAFFLNTSGQGKPEANWKWDREEIYEDRLKRSRR